jgi:hypothetical protein
MHRVEGAVEFNRDRVDRLQALSEHTASCVVEKAGIECA